MITNVLKPRLRNSSINGSRFTIDLSPEVQKHLKELNDLLGKPAFTMLADGDADEAERLRQERVEILEAVRNVEDNLRQAEADSIALADLAGDEKVESVMAESAWKSGDKASKDALKLEWDAKKKKQEATVEALMKKREEITQLRANYQSLRDDQERVATGMVMFNGGRAFHHDHDNNDPHFDLEDELEKPLLAKRTTAAKWDPAGILAFIAAQNGNGQISIADCIDRVDELSNLKHEFQQFLYSNIALLEESLKGVLNKEVFPNIGDYLLAYGYYVKGISDVNAMFNFVRNHKFGAKAIVDYAVVSTARYMIQKASLQIETIGGKTYNDDGHPLIKKILSSNISLHEDNFVAQTEKILKDFIANDEEMDIIAVGLANLSIAELPPSYYPPIISYMRSSSVKIDDKNIEYFLPGFINKVKGLDEPEEVEDTEEETIEYDKVFDVEFITDEKTAVKTNASNIRCASQLFTSMIMDTELDIFNLANFLTNNYLIRNRVDFEDRKLHQALQMFVFSNQFIDQRTKEKMERTDPAERQHFYRQVFNFGTGPVPQGVVVNHKFPKLWNQLVPAVQKYLEEASSSLSEDVFVSKGGVMQIVAGLKTNLSANCASMTKIISPVINAEWNFIITKILGHPEIVKQVAPAVGTWKGVAETLYAEMKQRTIDASLVYEKARISNAILKEVADYVPSQFEAQDHFLGFCSLVISGNEVETSIMQDTSSLAEGDTEDPGDAAAQDAYKSAGIPMPGANGSPAANGSSDWEF